MVDIANDSTTLTYTEEENKETSGTGGMTATGDQDLNTDSVSTTGQINTTGTTISL
jgi:hypothetical protein